MKVDWKKQDKALYLPGKKPVLVEVPAQKFFSLPGAGDPNDEHFSEEIGALYSLAYTLKMLPKKGAAPDGYYEYTVFPLEGLWRQYVPGEALDKDRLQYDIMIRQPDFVTEALAMQVLEAVREKKPNPNLDKVAFRELEDGLCVQMMHIGPYDDEPASFALMDEFLEQNGLRRLGDGHREIYLSDPRRVPPEKRRTVLRYQVEKGGHE